jgi:RNA polymerase sigma-70 factor (ECF subfamily)
MAKIPDTRVSLILRLGEPANAAAWQEFADIYTPALFALARNRGLQPADAEDVTQEILFGVARSVQRFQPDANRAKFRTWLWRIARNLLADFSAGRTRRPIAGLASDSWLDAICSTEDESPEDPELEREVRASMFRLAARRVQHRVAASTWAAFEASAIQGRPAAEIAIEQGLATGGVYVARCRVMKMIRSELELINASDSITNNHSGERSL